MISKVAVALFASCVVANAMTVDEFEAQQALRQKAVANIRERLASSQAGIDMLDYGMNAAMASAGGRTNKVKQQFQDSTVGSFQDTEKVIEGLPAGQAFANSVSQDAGKIKEDLLKNLRQKLQDIKSEFKSGPNPKISAATQAISSNGLYTTEMKKLTDSLSSANNAKKELDSFVSCQKNGQIHNGQKCAVPKMPTDLDMERVSHNLWKNEDSRNGGWLNSRHIDFTKKADNTAIRVFYYDNMRVHGHTAHGMWEIYICNSNGDDCRRCTDPGRLMHWRWSGHQHNWWMNDHTGGTVFGLCSKSEKGPLTKGQYRLRVNLHSNRYDLHTGHGGQHGSFMVDEVLRV